jgi:signal transduction histidine kinase
MTTILLVEDNVGDARLVQEALKQSMPEAFKLHHVVRVREAMHFLRQHRSVDVILSDISLPDAQGSETFQLLRKAAANVPVLFMTGSGDADLAIDALQKGAQDYLVKGEFSSEFLVRVILYAIERKKYQDEVSAAKAKTRALRQQARLLRQEQEQLVIINKAKDDFISLASHQLRTPATGVKQYIGMILEGFAGDVPEHLQPFLAKAYESNERQLAIVNDLLQVAQLDAGNIRLHRHHTNLTEMLLNIVSEQSSKFSQRRQNLVYLPSGPDIIAQVDAERMRMVFDNLIDNASKYTPESRTVTVSLQQTGQAGKSGESGESPREVQVSIKDEGVGIAPENIDKVFEKFSRVANSRSDLVGGSGLGLYWAKQIVDLHNGTIDVRSKVGEGSEFVVTLDAQDPHVEL